MSDNDKSCCKPKVEIQQSTSCCKSEIQQSSSCCKSEKVSSSCSDSGFKASSEMKATSEMVLLKDQNDLKYVFMSISGMTCAGCTSRIEKYLEQQPGVVSIEISLLTHKAKVGYNGNETDADEVLKMVEYIGFTPTEIVDGNACSVSFRIHDGEYKNVYGIVGVGTVTVKGDLFTFSYDPEVIGARQIYDEIREKNHGNAVLVSTPFGLEANTKMHRDQVRYLENKFLWSMLLTLPVVVVHFVLPLFIGWQSLVNFMIVKGLSVMDGISFVATTPIQFYVAYPIYESAYSALRYSKRANMDLLISLSTTAAYAFSVFNIVMAVLAGGVGDAPQTFFEISSMLITFILFGRVIEFRSKAHTMDSVHALMNLQVKTAILVSTPEDASLASESYIEIEFIQRDDVLKILPGARVPTDGIVISGKSKVDESMVTGESKSVGKEKGDTVIGGTINLSGMLLMKVTKVVDESLLSQIVRMVEDAQNSKPEAQRIADIVASYFTTMIIMLSVLMFFVWYGLAKSNVIHTDDMHVTPFGFALRFSITILVISCPCAISLAVPTAVMVATGIGAKIGVLFKGGRMLEMFHRVDTFIFDKTGTLTIGRPQVVNLTLLSCKGVPYMTDRSAFWKYVGSVEGNSEHPLGRSIVEHVHGLGVALTSASEFKSVPGCGVSAVVDGTNVAIGSLRWLQHKQVELPDEFTHTFESMQMVGCSVVCVSINNSLCGIIALRDEVRPEAKLVIRTLRSRGIQVWMMTGDQAGTAKCVAKELDIPEYCVVSNVLPDVKIEKISVLQGLGRTVAFVGDGINDAPALAGSDLGIAIGAGTDVALQTADLILVKSDLRDMLNALNLSAVAAQRIRWNFTWGFLYNLIMMPIASGALYISYGISIPPALAGLSELFSSVPVIVSSLLLNLWKPPFQTSQDLSDITIAHNNYGTITETNRA